MVQMFGKPVVVVAGANAGNDEALEQLLAAVEKLSQQVAAHSRQLELVDLTVRGQWERQEAQFRVIDSLARRLNPRPPSKPTVVRLARAADG